MGTIIAVDIGGTHLRTAAYESEQFKPSAYQRTNTLANEPGVFDRMVKAIEEVWPHTQEADLMKRFITGASGSVYGLFAFHAQHQTAR